MTRLPRGTGYCKACGRRNLLTRNGKLFLHAKEYPAETLVRCPGGMTREYTPGADQTYKETTP